MRRTFNNVDYILKTGPQGEISRKGITRFCKETTLKEIEILETTVNTVNIKAILEQNGHDASFTEKSLFEKKDDRWVYVRRLED